jgi:Flp pilus assembly protein TadD
VRVLAPLLPTTDDAEVLFQGARAHAGIGDRDRAIALSRRALEQRPDMGAAWLHLATWLEADGETDPALDAFARARALAPDHPGLAFTVARAQARAGRLDDAWTTLTAAIELGYRDTAAVRSAPELAPLRERAGFDELVRRMSGPR